MTVLFQSCVTMDALALAEAHILMRMFVKDGPMEAQLVATHPPLRLMILTSLTPYVRRLPANLRRFVLE